ncbi:MAG: putative porin [Verrucomicrobia bacterium]|nr:putative porin [Verrucomicrobiota bacterium]
MATTRFKWLALLGSALLGAASAAFAQDSGPLIDLLVKKGIVNDQEAETLRAELVKDFAANTSAGKLELSSRVQRFTLSGDVRVRYQYDNEVSNTGTAASQTNVNADRSRYRYRFRLASTVLFAQNWTTGIRLETANGATSTNADFAASGSTNFAKTNDTPYVGQVYIQYATANFMGADRVDFRIGKHAHPFFTPGVNGFWIDSDINVEGLSEEIGFNNLFGNWNFTARGGQYLLSSNAGLSGSTGRNQPDMMFVVQTEFSNIKLVESIPCGWRIAPGFIAFSDASKDAVSGTPAVAANGYANDSTNYTNLFTVLVPVEYGTKAFGQPLAFYGTYGLNLNGSSRADSLYSNSTVEKQLTTASGDPSGYNQMFNLGVRFGASKVKGDTQFTAEYRYVEPGAYTSLLLDSDFNGGRLNGRGFIFSASRNFTDAINGTVTYFHSENIDGDGRPSSATTGQGFDRADVLQVDLSAKF